MDLAAVVGLMVEQMAEHLGDASLIWRRGKRFVGHHASQFRVIAPLDEIADTRVFDVTRDAEFGEIRIKLLIQSGR